MTEAWSKRLGRYGMLARAPFHFVTVKAYRHILFESMRRGQGVVRSGIRTYRPRGSQDNYLPLELVLRQGPRAVCLFTPSIDPARAPPAELRRMSVVLKALVAADIPARVISVGEAAGTLEHAFRTHLLAEGVVPAEGQAGIEVVDGARLPIAVGPEDVFLCLAEEHAMTLRERLSERGLAIAVHVLAPEGEAEDLAALLRPLGSGRKGGARTAFDTRSRLGLGYRVLKPLPKGQARGRTCLFVHFDPGGQIDPYVVRYLEALKANGLDTVLISSCDLAPTALAAAEPFLAAAVARENKGLDFSGWALAMELFPRLLESDLLIIANDSVYGPVGDLDALFDRMEAEAFDVWGAVESQDPVRHFQSWLVAFRKPVIRSEAFTTFWSDVLPLSDKDAIIHRHEIPLWSIFEAAGFRVGAAVTCKSHGHADVNPMMDGWRAVLQRGMPFVKVQLMRDNPLLSNLVHWTREFRSRGYPAHLVLDHLQRVKGREAAALQDG